MLYRRTIALPVAALPVLAKVPIEHGPMGTQLVYASDGVLNVYVRVPASSTPTDVRIGAPENDRHEQVSPPIPRTTRLVVDSISLTLVDTSTHGPDGRLTRTLDPMSVTSSGHALALASVVDGMMSQLSLTCTVERGSGAILAR